MNNDQKYFQDEQRKLNALAGLRQAIPHTEVYSEMDFEELLHIMKQPVRTVSTCVSKEQLKVLCIQLLTQNLTLQAEVSRLKKELEQ